MLNILSVNYFLYVFFKTKDQKTMLETLIGGVFENLPPEMKGNLKKIGEFMPVIDMYHGTIQLDKAKGELGVSYLVRFENKDIILYQVVLASKPDVLNGKPFVSRQLNKWNVTEKINELTNG